MDKLSHQSQNEVTRPKTIGYLMSRFPKISETFILYEILELERLGLNIEVFPLIRQSESVMHPEAQAVVARAHYSTVLSFAVFVTQLYWLKTRPRAYLSSWWHAVLGNWRSRKFLLRACVIVPQAAWIAREMQSRSVQHIHAHWATHPALAAYVAHKLTDIPYSFTAHAHDIYVERPMLEEKIRQASFVVTISDYNRKLLQQLYGIVAADKVLVIHCGIDPAVFHQPAPKPSSNTFTIVCVASLQDYKGIPYLVQACAHLKAAGIQFRCMLIGEGEDRPEIEKQITQLGVANEVVLLGHQQRSQVHQWLGQADVMVMPSIVTDSGKQEGIPVALMEALAMEVPVVATEISGIPELIEPEQTGLLVPQRDGHALATALLRLYHSPALGRQLGSAGRSKVLGEFNLLKNTESLYELLTQDWSVPEAETQIHQASPSAPHINNNERSVKA